MVHKYFEDGHAPDFGDNLISQLKAKCPYIFLVCFRDKNKNVMIYQARVEHGKLLNPPIEAYWLNLEPSYREDRKKQNIHHDREEQSFLDKKFAWGFEQKRISDTEAKFKFSNASEAEMTVKLSSSSNEAQLFFKHQQRKYLIRSLYITASENIQIFNIRNNVKSLSLSGTDITAKPYKPAKIQLK
jgi:hypothetical protein